MYRGLHILRGKLPASLVEQRITGLRFLLPSGAAAEFSSEKLIGITVFRELFDEFLAKRAMDAGAELRELTKVKHYRGTDVFRRDPEVNNDGKIKAKPYRITGGRLYYYKLKFAVNDKNYRIDPIIRTDNRNMIPTSK